MVDYSSWDKWGKDIETDESEKEKQFVRNLAKTDYDKIQGKPMS